MAGCSGFGDDPLTPGFYSELLFGDEIAGLDTDDCFGFASSFPSGDSCNNSLNTPKMLCFGDYATEILELQNIKKPGQKPEPASTGSLPKSNKKRVEKSGPNAGAPTGSQRNGKKQKANNCTAAGGNAKVVKKEKLGERITALQQLVSPFGKTDTASVLHEALGYIRFLQDQVQVLCSPYLQRSTNGPPGPKGDGSIKEARKDDLRSRGLCLVPVELTVHVAESNGADLWTSAAILDSVYSN